MNQNEDLQGLLADLADAQGALRRSSTAFDVAMGGMRQALDGVAAANTAQGQAIDAVIAATKKALGLFRPTDRH